MIDINTLATLENMLFDVACGELSNDEFTRHVGDMGFFPTLPLDETEDQHWVDLLEINTGEIVWVSC